MLELVREHIIMAFVLAILALATIEEIGTAFAKRNRPVLCNCQCNKKHQKENE